MALKALMLRKKIDAKKKELDAIRTKTAELEKEKPSWRQLSKRLKARKSSGP